MEAPEKIYLQICGDCNDNDCENCKFEDLEDNVTWCKDKIFRKDIEYTRTDATWKPADGDNLPEIDREVIALVEEHGLCKVVFAHRPNPNSDATCYDKRGWNMPDIRYWLDLELPKMEE